MTEANARDLQKGVRFVLTIDGTNDWRKFVPTTLDLSHAGLGILEIEAGLRKVAEVNEVSFELTLAGYLAWRKGFELTALEIETTMHPEWGKMVWISDHSSYALPPADSFQEKHRMDFYRAMFKTEKAGIQHFCLYSTAIFGRFHKTIVFHKVVLNSPKAEPVEESIPASLPA